MSFKMIYPPKEAYVFSTPLANPFPSRHPDYVERTFAGKKRDEIDFGECIEEDDTETDD